MTSWVNRYGQGFVIDKSVYGFIPLEFLGKSDLVHI
jgi:hypothetical protein